MRSAQLALCRDGMFTMAMGTETNTLVQVRQARRASSILTGAGAGGASACLPRADAACLPHGGRHATRAEPTIALPVAAGLLADSSLCAAVQRADSGDLRAGHATRLLDHWHLCKQSNSKFPHCAAKNTGCAAEHENDLLTDGSHGGLGRRGRQAHAHCGAHRFRYPPPLIQ